MRRLSNLASTIQVGAVVSFVLESGRLMTLTQALPDGYYVVLVVDRTGSRAQALYRLRNTAQVLAREIV
jgi:hypothetical protein